MDKYLIEFLKAHTTLILPGLGALTLTDASSGELLFMPYLKHDDGRLAQFIASSEGIDEQRAQIMVAQYVRDIENRLNAEGSYTIYQFGMFTKKADGDIAFERVVPTELQTPETVEEAEVTTVVEEKEIEAEPVIHETVSTSSDQLVEQSIDTKQQYTKEDQWNDDLDLPPIGHEIPKVKKPILEKATPDKRKRKPVLILFLSIGVIGIGALLTYVMFYNTLEPVVQTSKKTTPKIPVAKKETTVTEESKSVVSKNETEVDTNKTEVSSTPIIESEGAYHVVVGAFTIQSNAERFLKRIQENGNPTASMHERYGCYFIHLSDFNSKTAATEACASAQSNFPGAWVYYFP